jgi:rhamnosyltransferase
VGHYAAWRHYWIARNGTTLVRENFRALPVWAVTNTLFLGRWFVQLVLFEPQRRSHARAFLRGLRDGFSGRVERSFVPGGAEYRGRG